MKRRVKLFRPKDFDLIIMHFEQEQLMSNQCVVIHFWSTNISFTECVSCLQVIDASRPGCMASGLI